MSATTTVNVPLNEVVERVTRGESIFLWYDHRPYKVKGVLARHTPDCHLNEWGAADVAELGVVTVRLESTFTREVAVIEREYREGDSLDSLVHIYGTASALEEGYSVIAVHLSTDGLHVIAVRNPEGVVFPRCVDNLTVRVYE